MLQPLVTVYITNYNYGIFIRQAIESVLAQDFKNLELLIIDDQYTDDSLEIISDYIDNSRVSLIQQKNKGLNVSNNVALHLARGKYIVRLDADDYFEANAISELIKPLENNSEIGLVFPDYNEIDVDGNLIRTVKRHDFESEVELYDQPAHGACTMVRTKFLQEVGGYDESFSCQDGFDLWIKFISKYRVTNVGKLLFNYRQHGFNLTKNEERLLATRSEMKRKHLECSKLQTPKTTVIIPVRSLSVSEIALQKINGKTLLEKKIESCLSSELATNIVVVTSDLIVEDIVKNRFDDNRIKIVFRDKKESSFNKSLINSIKLVHKSLGKNKNQEQIYTILSIEYPFLNTRYIDSSVRSMTIFGADSVISVRRNGKTLYSHSGKTIVPLQETNLTKYERDDLFESAGGLVSLKYQMALKDDKTQCGVVSHVLVDEISAFEIRSQIDRVVAEFLDSSSEVISESFSVIR